MDDFDHSLVRANHDRVKRYVEFTVKDTEYLLVEVALSVALFFVLSSSNESIKRDGRESASPGLADTSPHHLS